MALRLMQITDQKSISKENLSTITLDDINKVFEEGKT